MLGHALQPFVEPAQFRHVTPVASACRLKRHRQRQADDPDQREADQRPPDLQGDALGGAPALVEQPPLLDAQRLGSGADLRQHGPASPPLAQRRHHGAAGTRAGALDEGALECHAAGCIGLQGAEDDLLPRIVGGERTQAADIGHGLARGGLENALPFPIVENDDAARLTECRREVPVELVDRAKDLKRMIHPLHRIRLLRPQHLDADEKDAQRRDGESEDGRHRRQAGRLPGGIIHGTAPAGYVHECQSSLLVLIVRWLNAGVPAIG